jgi:hypothetical protein
MPTTCVRRSDRPRGPARAHAPLAQIIEEIRKDVGFIRTLHGATKEAAITAYQESMRLVFIAILVAAVLAFITTLPLGVHSLCVPVCGASARRHDRSSHRTRK